MIYLIQRFITKERKSMSNFGGFAVFRFIQALGIAALWMAISLSVGQLAQAQSTAIFPTKPIHLVVPFPPGGALDIVARTIAKPLGTTLGQPVIIDNRAGADGAIAADFVAKSEPNGYTLFMATYGSMSALPFLHKSLPYNVLNDFTPISNTGKFAFFLFAHPSIPSKDLNQLIAYIHAHPDEVNYGSGNVGGVVGTAELAQLNHLKMIHVPYKGEVPAMNDFLAGRVQVMLGTPANALEFVKQGKLNAVVTFLDKRSSLLPQTPTMHELGYPNLSITPWSGIFGPAKLSPAIASRLSLAINDAMKGDDVQAEFAKQAFESKSSTPSELGAYVRDQLQHWGHSIELAGLSAQ
jgi:tripartite-type tricarboxylate transporter receptor subunit TctC